MSITAPETELFSDEFIADPWPLLTHLRENDPCHWVESMMLWLVTPYDDVKRLLHDGDLTTGDRRAWELYEQPAEGTFDRWMSDNNLLALATDEHNRLRRLVSAAFTRRAIARMEQQIADVVEQFAAPLRGRTDVVDMLNEFTSPIPNTVISRITGIPPLPDDEARFRDLALKLMAGFLPLADEATRAVASEALQEMMAWVRTLARERSVEPREDLISDLVHTQDLGDRMTGEEIILLVAGLIGAGSETTTFAANAGITKLLENRDVMRRLAADRSLVPGAVLEILRFGLGGPGVLPRYAVRDFELHGRTIRRGQMILLGIGAANTDPAQFADPLRFDIERCRDDILTFGFGPHYCLGAHLAKCELRNMVDAILDIVPPEAEILTDQIEHLPIGVFKRPLNLPVDLDPGR